MRYSNRTSFILSTPGTMGQSPCSLESVMSGHAAGAHGCVLPVDTTRDDITIICETSSYQIAGETLSVHDNTFETLRAAYPKIVSFGQALELVRSYSGKIGIELHHPLTAAQVRISLKYSEYLENAYFCGLLPQQAAALAAQYPDLQVMVDLPLSPEDPVTFVRGAQRLGLFGLRAAPELLSEALCNEALRCGLFLASTDTNNPEVLHSLVTRGVNFIETSRPDLALSGQPAQQA